MTFGAHAFDPDSHGPLLAPDELTWRAMSAEQRRTFIDRVHDALNQQRDAMSEGRPHFRAKTKALDMLGRYFQRIGRRIYLASELPVLYPGERIVQPDLIAVLDVEDTGEQDERSAWVVADEGKGPDLAMEVYYRGDEGKDFVQNVEDYARLGIHEYFIYDRRRQTLSGYRLSGADARKYRRLPMRFGRLASSVLGLEMQVRQGRLRFYQGDAELPDSDELIARIESMVDDLEVRRDEAEARAEQEQQRAEQEQQRASQILDDLRAAVLEILVARGLAVTEELQQLVAACADSATLRRWAIRAGTVSSADDVAK